MPVAAERALLSWRQHRGTWTEQILRRAILCGAAALVFVSLPAPAHAWGCEGHQVIALLAEKHLTPHALAMAEKILADGPVDPNLSRYCKQGGSDPLADASTWPDDIRGQRPETAPWHYVDIPLGTKRRDVEKYCDPKESCITRAIREQMTILSSTSGSAGGAAEADPIKKANALRFLIHFVGDLHQPMHAATNNDAGGNCVPVAFFDTTPQLRNPKNESYSPNLHAIWDVNILERATPRKTVEEVAAELNESFGRKIAAWQRGPANVVAWAWESHQAALKTAYGKLPVPIPVEPPQSVTSCADDNHVSARMLKLDEHLGEPYQNASAPIVRQSLAKAGARLALLLNELWP